LGQNECGPHRHISFSYHATFRFAASGNAITTARSGGLHHPTTCHFLYLATLLKAKGATKLTHIFTEAASAWPAFSGFIGAAQT
jgi:hypothetical protein